MCLACFPDHVLEHFCGSLHILAQSIFHLSLRQGTKDAVAAQQHPVTGQQTDAFVVSVHMADAAAAEEAGQSMSLTVAGDLRDGHLAVDGLDSQFFLVNVLAVQLQHCAAAVQIDTGVTHRQEVQAAIPDDDGNQSGTAAVLAHQHLVDALVGADGQLHQRLLRLAILAYIPELTQEGVDQSCTDSLAVGQAAHAVSHQAQNALLAVVPSNPFS